MRRATTAILTAALLALAVPAIPVLGASDAKVVIVVGPVGSSTAHYKSDAEELATEARRYTSNVVRITTPNATWAAVKAAAQGASVFVYLGHGNGWPSPYPPFQTLTKNGLGLDPSTGADSTKTVYYGEDYIRNNIRFAPNAVVLLYHLCYASGNTEPGLPQGTLTDARQRVDNYGAGFIGAGARAVFAEGHPSHPVVNYMRQLFTTNRTMDQVFRNAPTWNGNLLGPYASQRTPGLRLQLDPKTSTPSGFYRSVIGDLALTAGAVTGERPQSTGTHPTEFAVPGAAEVVAGGGIPLFASAGAAADPAASAGTTLPVTTRLRLVAEAAPMPDGTRVFEATVLDSATRGFIRAPGSGPDVAPRDSAAPVEWTVDASASLLSPNGDGTNDALVVAARYSETVAATLVVKNASGSTVKSLSLTGDLTRFSWDLTSGGAVIRDGGYTWTLRARDAWGNAPVTRTGSFTVDATPPASKAAISATAGGSGWLVSPVVVTLSATDALTGVKSIAWRIDGGTSRTYTEPVSVTGNGTRLLEFRATDAAGNREAWRSVSFKVDTKPPVVEFSVDGSAGPDAGSWRGAVSVSASVTDAASGVASRTVSVDGAAPVALPSSPIVVDGEGSHTIAVTAKDVAGNAVTTSTTFSIDDLPPVIESLAGEAVPTVTPNGDGVGEVVRVPIRLSEPATVTAVVKDASGATVRTVTAAGTTGDGFLAWDGRTAAGAAVPDGRYTLTLTATDGAGNASPAATAEVDVYAALAGIARSPIRFFPQDGDALAPRSRVTFRLLSPATVDVSVISAKGTVVRRGIVAASLPAGSTGWTWDGRRDDGSFAPRGTYRFVVRATNGVQAASGTASVLADAFALRTSVTTAVRGRALTITATTVEPLSTAPRVVVRQPGLTAWSVAMTRVSTTTWKATLTPRAGGSTGTMSLTVKAKDSRGGLNSSVVRLPLK